VRYGDGREGFVLALVRKGVSIAYMVRITLAQSEGQFGDTARIVGL
jgi:hypothetical protein